MSSAPIQLGLNTKDLDVEAGTPTNSQPSFAGVPLKYLSLVTLAVQNSALTIIMHYSRVSTPPERMYLAATAVLMNEILKGLISFVIAFCRVDAPSIPYESHTNRSWTQQTLARWKKLWREIFSPDCWKLSIPAILYVIQNNLQYVAASNLEAATFQVTYQMKILTTAVFSVVLLRKKLYTTQWLALLCLAIGVGVVQIQATTSSQPGSHHHSSTTMNPLKGFIAVTSACFTSGLAGVYFEMVLKNSQADLWVRNVQLSLFSLLPALAPIIVHQRTNATTDPGNGFIQALFANFGAWAWATVLVQVFGGLITALVIKYSDNILKGFATSLSIVISFLASVILFDFEMSFTFVLGSTIVLIATWLYNQTPSRPCFVIPRDSWAASVFSGWTAEKYPAKSGDYEALRSPPPNSQFVALSAISTSSSTSSLSSAFMGTPRLSSEEARPFIRS